MGGAVALHFLGAIYFFTISGMVINYYFIPSVQCICNDLKITPVRTLIWKSFCNGTRVRVYVRVLSANK